MIASPERTNAPPVPAAPPPQTERRSPAEIGFAVLATLAAAAIAVLLGLLLGRRIGEGNWEIFFTAAALAVYVAVALVDVRHALLLWMVTSPFSRFVHLDIDLGRGIPNLTLNRVMTGLLLILVLAQLAAQRRRLPRLNWVDVTLLLFCAASALSLPNAVLGLRAAAQSYFDLLIVPLAVYILARNAITNMRELRTVMVALAIIGVYLALLATREQLTGDVWFYSEGRGVTYSSSIRRVVGLLGNPAYIAVSIGMGVPWVWYLFLHGHGTRLRWLFALGTMMMGIYYCMNRSGWLALVAALVVMAIFVQRFRRIFVVMVIVGAVLGTLYWALISTSATFRERLQAQGPIEYRVETWEVAWRMIKDNLAFGVGYENFQHFYRRYGYWDVYLRAQPTPHNTFLWVFLMGGLVAFVPFMAFLAAVFFTTLGYFLEARQDANSFPNVELIGTFLASMTVILVPSAVMDSLTGYFNNMIMFLILGAFFGVVSGERRLAAEALRERTRAEHRLATARMEDSRRSATQRSEHALR